jgi:hypothetical protein
MSAVKYSVRTVISKDNQALFNANVKCIKSLGDCTITSLGDGDYLYDLTNCDDVVIGFEDAFKREGVAYGKEIMLPTGSAYVES